MARLLTRFWHWLRGSHTCRCGHRFNPDHTICGAFVDLPEGTVFCRKDGCECETDGPKHGCKCP